MSVESGTRAQADIYELNRGWEADAVRKVYQNYVYKTLSPHQKTWCAPSLPLSPLSDTTFTNSSSSNSTV